MKFVFFGYDFSLGIPQRLIDDGHELIGVFTFSCDNIFNFNREIIALAQSRGMPLFSSKPTDVHIDAFLNKNCECFIVAGYPYKVPPIDETKAYGLNVHPAYLPKGRGLMPTPHIIMNHPEAAGITVHKLAAEYDAGDILYQEKFELSPRETVETYSERAALAGPEILSRLLADLPRYWREAKPQDESQASLFPTPDDSMRTLDFTKTVEELDRVGRAFGHFGCLAHFKEKIWAVYRFETRVEKHSFAPGTLVDITQEKAVLAAKDGFLDLTRFMEAG
jgi:methionyl-tRNA formyltransferase